MSQPHTIGNILDRIPAEQRHCAEHGDYLARLFRDYWSTCPKCRQVKEAQEKIERERQEEAYRIAEWIRDSGIPIRFRECTLASYAVENEAQQRAKSFSMEFAASLAEKTDEGRSAIFCGTPGTGKTHLACAIARAAIEAKRSAIFTTTGRLVRRIKATWSRDSDESESDAIDAFTRPALLVLDEVGVQFGSETEKMFLFDVLNERYENRRSTIIVSNLDVDGIKGFLGERIFDRMREDGGVYIPFSWESHRGK